MEREILAEQGTPGGRPSMSLDRPPMSPPAAATRSVFSRFLGANRTISLRGWFGIFKQAFAAAGHHNISLIASGVAFYALLAIFPALGVFVSLYGLIADPITVEQQINNIASLFPAEGVKLINDQLQALIAVPRGHLSVGLVVSIVLALFTARSGASAMMGALNIAYGAEEKRGIIMQNLVAIAMTLAILVFIVFALGMIAIVPAIFELLGLSTSLKWLAALIRWPLLAAFFMAGLACAYQFAPSRPSVRWSSMSPGAAAATALWIAASGLFSLYVSAFGSYDKTYGSLGAVVILSMWFYISALAVLIGAEINAETERYLIREARRTSLSASVQGF
jgi:membrane protein